jgi:hypothetical protein
MLRQEFAAGRVGRGHLHVRMHFLHELRSERPWRTMPQLRRQFFASPDPTDGIARQVPAIHETCAESRRLRTESRLTDRE